MKRFYFIALGIIGLGAIAATLFIVENEVRTLRDDLREINHQIQADRDAIHVMKAEWAYLTQPQRIAKLTKENLPELGPQQSSQYYSEKAAITALSHTSRDPESVAAR